MLKLSQLRKLISEYAMAISRNYHTIDNDPFSWMDDPDIDVEHYAIPDEGHHIKISVLSNPSMSKPVRVFADEEEAMTYARKEVDRIRTTLMNHDDGV